MCGRFRVSVCVCVCVCVCARARARACATIDTYRHIRPYKANALREVREVRANRYKHESTVCMKYVPINVNKAGCNK